MKCTKTYIYLVLIYLVIVLSCFFTARIVNAPIRIETAEAHEQVEERDDIDRLIDQLAICESGGNPYAINYDDGAIGSHSYGLLQIKLGTFAHWNKVYKVFPDLEDGEIMNVIFDPDVQRKIAKEALKDGQWRAWYNCNKKFFL